MADAAHNSLDLSHYLPYRLVNLAKRVSDACNAEYGAPYGISIAEWRILARLGQQGKITSRGLGDVTFMDKSRVSRALQQLQSKGYLGRQEDPADKRASFLQLTPEGHKLYQQLVPLAREWEARFISALNTTEYRDLLSILQKLDRQLDVT